MNEEHKPASGGDETEFSREVRSQAVRKRKAQSPAISPNIFPRACDFDHEKFGFDYSSMLKASLMPSVQLPQTLPAWNVSPARSNSILDPS